MDPPLLPDPEHVEAIVRAAADRAVEAAGDAHFATFQCGTGLPASLRGAPPTLQDAFRREVRSALRKRLESTWPGRRHDTEAPDLFVDALPDRLDAEVRFAPLLVAGRYRKLVRGLSQTVFHCRVCRGRRRAKPCDACAGTGRLVAESVEDFVRPAIERSAGGSASAFHGAGREDVDVRMLGAGRPFVVSVEAARTRAPDLAAAAAEVVAASGGRVEVEGLRVVTRAAMRRITSDHGRKGYRALVVPAGEADFPADAAERVAAMSGAALAQRTPQRVDARRADLVRERRVLSVVVEESGPRRLVLALRTEPGTYVKEFITGDDGRTTPSVSGALGVPSLCAELDVTGVEEGAAE